MVPKPKGVNERSSRNRDDLRWTDCGYFVLYEEFKRRALQHNNDDHETSIGPTTIFALELQPYYLHLRVGVES